MNDCALPTDSYAANRDCRGQIKIWQFDPATGQSRILHDKPNTILYSGADLLAQALTGKQHSGISHMCLGFNNNDSFDFQTEPSVTRGAGVMRADGQYGYIRVPLTFPASFTGETNYDNNTAYFTIMLTSPPASVGAEFHNGSKIFAVGLVAALNASGANQDKMFSRALFTPVTYDATFGLTVTWGVRFTAA